MKRILLVLFATISLFSCNIKEEIYINKDGSGKVNYEVDFGSLLSQMATMAKSSKGDNSKMDKKVDTIIRFKDVIKMTKDSIAKLSAEKQALYESMKDFELRMQMDVKAGKGVFALNSDFDHISKINNLDKIFQKASNKVNKKTIKTSSVDKYGFKYEFEKKKVRRIVYENKLSKEEEKEYQDKLTKGQMVFSQSKYTILYHFERKIKAVSNKDAKISKDKKTLEITYPMDTVLKNPYLLEFEVKLK
ncbi:hypothetical protein [Wenyingzhuangia sp. IMCC45574]